MTGAIGGLGEGLSVGDDLLITLDEAFEGVVDARFRIGLYIHGSEKRKRMRWKCLTSMLPTSISPFLDASVLDSGVSPCTRVNPTRLAADVTHLFRPFVALGSDVKDVDRG